MLRLRFWACRRIGEKERHNFFSCRQPLAKCHVFIFFPVAILAKSPCGCRQCWRKYLIWRNHGKTWHFVAKVSIACFCMMYHWSETKGKKSMHTHRQIQTEIHMYAHLGTRTNTDKYVSQAILPRREEKIAGNASPRATEFDYRIGRKSRGSAEEMYWAIGNLQWRNPIQWQISCRHCGDLAHDYFIFFVASRWRCP